MLTQKSIYSLTERGISLLDVLFSTALVSLCFLLVYGGKSRGSAHAALQAENVRANAIIVEKIETIRQCSWAQINSNGFIRPRFTEHFVPASSGRAKSSARTRADDGIMYYGTISLSNAAVSGAYRADLKELTVALNWTHSGSPRSCYLTTFLSPNKVANNF